MKCGLLGEKLNHSYSPAIHKMFGDYAYELFEKSFEGLEDFLKCNDDTMNNPWDGINITIPYKKSVIPFIDELSDEAAATNSVNTIVRRDSKLIGYNTDIFGFEKTLEYFDIDVSKKKVLILGDGGAAASVRYVLNKYDAITITLSRNSDHKLNYYDADIIVNATPVGMFPNNGDSILSSDNDEIFNIKNYTKLSTVIDLIYNPARTKLLLDAEKLGKKAINGLYMLVAQAAKSSELFTGKKISSKQIEQAYKSIDFSSKNIVLIGMPGVGKSTEGKELAKESGREFYDADVVFKDIYNLTPATVIETIGENEMRRKETEVLKMLGAKTGAIIATGGGCVTRVENYDLIHQNGIIVLLDSPVKSLEIADRPLSNNNDLEKLFEERKESYESWADIKLTYGKDKISYENISDKWSKH